MVFTLILENSSGDRIDMTTAANQYMTSKISGLHPPPGTVSTSSYAGMDGTPSIQQRGVPDDFPLESGSYLNNAFIKKRNLVISFEMRGVGLEKRRHALYRVVKPSRYIKVFYKTAGIDVYTEGYVETCEVDHFTNGKDGENGLSAYELAVQNGFAGTLTEWLNSLKGADGKDGTNGVDGKDGADGVNGKDGADGVDGRDGTNGIDGKDGLSAYEIALKNGFVGTESEWLEFLKGKDGADGSSPEVSGFATTEYVDERLSEILVILENLPTASTVTLFSYGDDVPEKYGDNIFTIYQNGIQDLSSYIRNHKPFCSAANGYALSYNQTDFGWDGQVYTASTTPITVKSGTAITVTAQSGVTEKGAMYLIPTAGKSDSDTVQNYIYTSVTTGNCVDLPFYWLYCDTFITGLTACDAAADGEYYLCWVGRSNNSHPVVREVKVMN